MNNPSKAPSPSRRSAGRQLVLLMASVTALGGGLALRACELPSLRAETLAAPAAARPQSPLADKLARAATPKAPRGGAGAPSTAQVSADAGVPTSSTSLVA